MQHIHIPFVIKKLYRKYTESFLVWKCRERFSLLY